MDSNLIIAIGTIVIAFATILQAYVTYLVARSLSSLTKLSSQISNTRNLNEQWQAFNLLPFTSPGFCKTLTEMGYLGDSRTSEDKLKRLSVIFYILNILYDMYHAKKAGIILERYVDISTRDQIAALSRDKAELLEILEGNRGYDTEFIEYVKKFIPS